MDVNLDDDFIKYGRSRSERHRVTVNSSIDDSIFVEVQLKGGINITVIEDKNNNVTTRVIAEETNIVTRKHTLQDSPNELEDITNKINELISSNNVPLVDNIKELNVAQESVQKMLEINSSPHNIERLEYLLIILKTSIAEKTKENENIERILKLIDLVMEQLENPQKISQFDALVTIVKDIEKLVKTVHNKVIQEKVDAVLNEFNDLNEKRKSVIIPDNSKIDRLMELKELLDTESFTTMKLNKLENIYDEILDLQKDLRNSNYSSLVEKLENEALMLFQNVKLFDDIDRRMIADVDDIDLNDLNELEKNLLELLRKINNPIAIENIESKLTEMRDTLRTYYAMENNVEPHIALNHIEYVLNNTVVLGGVKTLIDIHLELTQYLKTATNEELKNQATKLLMKTEELIDDLEIAQRILDKVEQLLNQTYDEKAFENLQGHKSSLIGIMNTIKDQQLVITAKKMLFDIQRVVSELNTVKQIMNIRKAAIEIDESLDAEVVDNPIVIYRRIERMENEAKELSKSNISPIDKQNINGILDISTNLKLKLSEASSTLFKSIENLIKLINTLKTKNLPLMRKNYDKVVEKFESFNDTIRNEEIGGLEERLDMVHTDYYRIDKSLGNMQQKLSSFSSRRNLLSRTYPHPVDQKKANDILSKLDAAMNQPNVTENIMTIRKILLDIKHAEETLSQAKNILEHFNNLNENKLIDLMMVPEEEKELDNKNKKQYYIEYTDYTAQTNSTFIDYLEDTPTNLEDSAINESTGYMLHETDLRNFNTNESYSLLTNLMLGDESTAENTTTDVPVDITTENGDQITENITTDVPESITTENEDQSSESEDQSTENEDQSTENITTDASVGITTENEDQSTKNRRTDDLVAVTIDNEDEVSGDSINATESEGITTEITITNSSIVTTGSEEGENKGTADLVNIATESLLIDKLIKNSSKNEEPMIENATNVVMNITTDTENLEIADKSTEHKLEETVLIKLKTNESFSTSTDINIFYGNDTTPENTSIEISASSEDKVEENVTIGSLEVNTTGSESISTKKIINALPNDDTRKYESPIEISTEKAELENNLEHLKMKMTNPKFTDLEELQNDLVKTLDLPPSSDKDKLLIELLKIKAEIQERILKGTSISGEDSQDSFEIKKPIKEINNDLMKISDIKKTAKNYSTTINSNIIVNLKSINSTVFDSNLLENNVKALLEDSINVDETFARINETRTYLDEVRPEVNDDQQWIFEQLESYLFNVELDSLTSILIADIKTLLSNFNN